ncbi:hypothetical protein FA95DRAFT_1559584 [Auriscalpium vulgare]|uniref:Uncharacterized protein n=1 Tax=Auriscalpium vulgare TaxID=40419 RepID=A0ACB8RSW9_9AGAM|nr:hypothetical protein FA95DRAFT_1559584 [Auriscalpium vulgare]
MTTNRISYFERINAGIAPARDDDNPRMHPELVLSEDSDIASMRTLQPGSHGFAFPIHDPLLSALLTTPKFRVLLQRGKARIYCGLYRADAWREMDVLAPEFLHMSAETRTHVVARMASSAPGSDPFNELYKDLALSTRVIPCVLLQCLRPHSSVYVDPRVRRAPPGLPAASSSGVGVYQRTAPPPPPSSQSEDPSSRMLYATRDSSQWAPAPGSPGGGYQAPYVASGARI